MPKVTFVKSARKAIPSYKIEKGESYYHWAFMVGGRGGPKICSKTRPKPSQLTLSEFWGAVFSTQESAENVPNMDDIESERDNIVSELENIRDETQGKYDNLPDSLQQGSSGELLQGRIDAIEEAISEIESVDCSIDEEDIEEADLDEHRDSRANEIWGEVTDALGNISCE